MPEEDDDKYPLIAGESGSYFEISGVAGSASLEEIFKQIDALRASDLKNPSIIQQMVNSLARNRVSESEKTISAAIEARRKVIIGLGESLNIYIQSHADTFKIRTAAHMSRTFAAMLGDLNSANETSVKIIAHNLSETIAEISRIPNLPDELKKKFVERATERTIKTMERADTAFASILDSITQQVNGMIQELGGTAKG